MNQYNGLSRTMASKVYHMSLILSCLVDTVSLMNVLTKCYCFVQMCQVSYGKDDEKSWLLCLGVPVWLVMVAVYDLELYIGF